MVSPVTASAPVLPPRREDRPAALSPSSELPPNAVEGLEVETAADVLHAFEKALNSLLPETMPPQTRLIIEVDPDTRRFVYKSIDASSGELVRQWPSEDILRMIKIMRDLSGITIDATA